MTGPEDFHLTTTPPPKKPRAARSATPSTAKPKAEKPALKKTAVKAAAKAPAKPSVKRVKAEPAPPAPHEAQLALMLAALEDAKAEEIVTIDLRGRTSLADAMIIATGRSNRHVSSVVHRTVEMLKEAGFTGLRSEGEPQCDWVLLDAGDIILHVFRPEVRAFYNLEKMWGSDRPAEELQG